MVKSWQDISLEMYYEILDISPDSNPVLQMLAIIEDLDLYSDEFLDLELDEVYERLERYKFVNGPIIPRKAESIELNGFKLSLLPLNQITLGMWIDLDAWIAQHQNKSLEWIASTLYRQTSVDDWFNIVYEPYSYDVVSRAAWWQDVSIDLLYTVSTEFLNFKANLIETFKSLWIDPEDLDENIETENLDDEQVKSIVKEIQQDKADASLGWQYLLLELSNNDFVLAQKLLDLPVIYIFNLLVVKRKADAKQNQTPG